MPGVEFLRDVLLRMGMIALAAWGGSGCARAFVRTSPGVTSSERLLVSVRRQPHYSSASPIYEYSLYAGGLVVFHGIGGDVRHGWWLRRASEGEMMSIQNLMRTTGVSSRVWPHPTGGSDMDSIYVVLDCPNGRVRDEYSPGFVATLDDFVGRLAAITRVNGLYPE